MRYEPATQQIIDLYNEVCNEFFPGLVNIKVMVLLDTKKRKSKGKIVLGRIKIASEVEKFLTTDVAPDDGFDYVMFIDKNVVQHCEEMDIKRIIRHELRHVFITERGKLSLIPHSLEDFYEEVELNAADPRWSLRVVEMISLIYEQEEDE